MQGVIGCGEKKEPDFPVISGGSRDPDTNYKSGSLLSSIRYMATRPRIDNETLVLQKEES